MVVVIEWVASLGNGIEPMRSRSADYVGSVNRDAKRRWRPPDVRCQVRMRVIHASVENSDDIGCRTCGHVPGRFCLDIRPGNAGLTFDDLARVQKTPLQGELWVIRNGPRPDDVVRLHIRHGWMRSKNSEQMQRLPVLESSLSCLLVA